MLITFRLHTLLLLDVRKVISNMAKNLRNLISKRTEKLATTVHDVSGVEKDSLDRVKLAEKLKPTMNNGKRGIRSFVSTNLTRLHQSSGRSKASNDQNRREELGNEAYLLRYFHYYLL